MVLINVLTSAYENMITKSPITAHVKCFFDVSIFSELPELFTSMNAAIAIDTTARGAAK